MAAVTINLAASVSIPPTSQATQSSPGFPAELHALMGATEIPDPGGGPPTPTAEGGASNPGPNAQSNQPDFLPLLAIAELPVNSIGVPSAPGSGGKSAKSTSPDPSLMALAAVATVPTVPTVPTSPTSLSQPASAPSAAIQLAQAATSGVRTDFPVTINDLVSAAPDPGAQIQFDLNAALPAPSLPPATRPVQDPITFPNHALPGATTLIETASHVALAAGTHPQGAAPGAASLPEQTV